MTQTPLRLVDTGDMDKQKALDAALGQIDVPAEVPPRKAASDYRIVGKRHATIDALEPDRLHALARAFALETGLLHAAEWNRRAGYLGAIDGDHAVLQGPGQSIDAVGVFGVHVGNQPVLAVIRPPQGFRLVIERRYRGHRAERQGQRGHRSNGLRHP